MAKIKNQKDVTEQEDGMEQKDVTETSPAAIEAVPVLENITYDAKPKKQGDVFVAQAFGVVIETNY